MQRGERVAPLHALAEAEPQAFMLANGTRVCVVRCGDRITAFEDRCPHRDFPLSGGDVSAEGVLECPWHGARFDVRTGGVLQGPATDPLNLLPVQVDAGEVFVLCDQLAQEVSEPEHQ